jgi:hypothetical protein
MPPSTSPDARDTDGAIRAAVRRLSRNDGDGGAVIERAAIVAEGSEAAAIEAWILAHGGEPEAPLITSARPGLHGLRPESRLQPGARPPRRYVLPSDALTSA